MVTKILAVGAVALGLGLSAAGPAAIAQETLQACSSQQELEQVINSDGTINPDGCRTLSVSALTAQGQRLCLLDFGSSGEGVLDTLRDAAAPAEWWVPCDQLAAAAAP